ncbi:hypothetical protein MSSIT_0696 [Methanosarcina siciliae T4/M]|uniref:Uncharacterized protein n=2 Tax=Methanosarcina siciliae TaxID=38027 RepID=A0A0E3PAX4_9EURY|nr:hypothetical protein MSSIT_0696 [Methanosarcina siciliae T4/M]AKB31358.1 hypothetical protein MSSIH_0668 [Methanosarcina siciliae HI350]
MVCISMQLFYLFYESLCFAFVFYVSGISDKYGVFEFFPGSARAFQGFIVIQGLILRTSFSISSTLEAFKFYSCAPEEHYDIFN